VQAEPIILIGMMAIVFAITVAAVYVFSKLAPSLGLLALPGEHRLHQNPTPMVGGIAIYLGLLQFVFAIAAEFAVNVCCWPSR